MSGTFTLDRTQAPEPPFGSTSWFDWLRWTVCVMNPSDPQFGFAASLLSQTSKTGALTEKQAAAANRMIRRVIDAHEAGDLLCLKTGPDAEVITFTPRIAVDNTKGGA